MAKTTEEKLDLAGGCIVSLITWPLSILASATTVMWLWWWFAVPFGLPPVTMAHAYGIDALITYMTWHRDLTKKDPPHEAGHTGQAIATFSASLFKAGFFLLLGWLAHLAMGRGF